MESIYYWLWVGFLLAAYFLWASKRGNLPLTLGIAGMGINNLRFAALQWHWIEPETLNGTNDFFQIFNLAAIGLLILGVIMLAAGQTNVRSLGITAPTLLDAGGQNLSTLFIPRDENNTYSRGEKLRDAACELLVTRARNDGIAVIVQKSNAHSPTVWFRLDYLLPQTDPNMSLRAHVEIHIERYDFHRFENLFTVKGQVGIEAVSISGVIEIDNDATERIHQFITTPGKRLKLPNRVRLQPIELWLPKNKVSRLRQDWAGTLAILGGVVLFVVPVIGLFLAIGFFVWFYRWNRRRRTYVLTSGRPMTEPRSLRWMDSWQATIVGLGGVSQNLSAATMQRLRTSSPADLSAGVERIGYWGLDGRVERDQVVVRYRQALGFVHIVAHGENLYVAWECHINTAAWAEQTLAKGIDKTTGRLVHANRVVSGVKFLNEYDVADSNFLAEWIHESVKREVKLKMTDHQIDQEVDFTVQRESRKDAISGEHSSQPAKQTKSGLNHFKRIE